MLDEPDVLEEELHLYKKAGGGTVVDVNVHGVRLDPTPLPTISKSTGINIICGTGFYVDALIRNEIKVGVGVCA